MHKRDLATVALHMSVTSTAESSDNRPVKFAISAYANHYERGPVRLPVFPCKPTREAHFEDVLS